VAALACEIPATQSYEQDIWVLSGRLKRAQAIKTEDHLQKERPLATGDSGQCPERFLLLV
jgi:hypothetical protein